jgi:HD superfamily phosphohydrolase
MVNDKKQRIRDPIYGLMVFEKDNTTDQTAWKFINTPEFQRLRRIRQLGFSEFVFPGATHTRFSHSIGVYHTARQLIKVIEKLAPKQNRKKAEIAAYAALLHDIGHGPFSHTFETAYSKIYGKKKKHEVWTAEIIKGSKSILEILGDDVAEEVANLLLHKEPSPDIYETVVSSQFDADRLDYLRRDRYMTGVAFGGIDFDWLLDSLRVGQATISAPEDKDDLVEVPVLYLSDKGLQAAEEYLLARFNLYGQVYMHKTVRSAEVMLSHLLMLISKAEDWHKLIEKKSPLGRFLSGKELSVSDYLELDDSVIMECIDKFSEFSNENISDLSKRLRDRRLYKCVDIGKLYKDVKNTNEPALLKFKRELKRVGSKLNYTVLLDEAKLSPYDLHDYDESGALEKVLIGKDSGGDTKANDVAIKSVVVKALDTEKIFRVYVPEENNKNDILTIWREATSG